MNQPVNMEAQCSTFLQNHTLIGAYLHYILSMFLRSVKLIMSERLGVWGLALGHFSRILVVIGRSVLAVFLLRAICLKKG